MPIEVPIQWGWASTVTYATTTATINWGDWSETIGTATTGNYNFTWTPVTTYTYNNNTDDGERWDDAFAVVRAGAEQQQQRRAILAAARVEATSRAESLLLEMLSQSQRERYQLLGEFEVMGSAGTLYRIKRGVSGNVEWVNSDGVVGGRLCAHPTMRDGWLPTEDVVLAQFLALTTDEPAFLRLANVHAGSRPPILV